MGVNVFDAREPHIIVCQIDPFFKGNDMQLAAAVSEFTSWGWVERDGEVDRVTANYGDVRARHARARSPALVVAPRPRPISRPRDRAAPHDLPHVV